MKRVSTEDFDEEETVKRRDAALVRALGTPHKRQAEMKVGKAKIESTRGANPEKPQEPRK
jgi:hypothetical protein